MTELDRLNRLKQENIRQRVAHVSWAAVPRFAGAGIAYVGGFYDFASSADDFSPAILVNRSADYGAEDEHDALKAGAWKRTDLNQTIAGEQSEGVIVAVV